MSRPGRFFATLRMTWLGILLAACGGAAAPKETSKQPLSQTVIHYSIGTASGSQVLPDVALAAGYFKEEGLDVDVVRLTGGAETLAALSKGETHMSNTDAPSTIQAHVNGLPTVIIAVPITKPIFDVMAAPSIKTPQDLKGKTVGVSRVGDSTYFQFALALQSWGLKPQQDVDVRALQEYPAMLAGLINGQIAAATLAAPFNFQAQKLGFHSLADLSQLPINYPTNSVQTTQKFVIEHPDTLRAFLRAYLKGIQRFKNDKVFMVDVYRRFLKSDDTEVIEQTWEMFRKLVQDDPTPTAEGIQYVLDSLVQLGNEKARTANPSDFINTDLIKQAKEG